MAIAPAAPGVRLPAWRWLAVAALVVAGAVVLARAGIVRSVEAHASAAMIGWLTDSDTFVAGGRAAFYWLMGTGEAKGLRITTECSVAYVIGPLLVLCGLLTLLRRLPLRRILAAAAVGVALISVVNLLRMVMVAFAITHYPSERAMWWWHTVVGSIVSLLGIGAGLAAVTRIAFGGRVSPSEPAGPPASPPDDSVSRDAV